MHKWFAQPHSWAACGLCATGLACAAVQRLSDPGWVWAGAAWSLVPGSGGAAGGEDGGEVQARASVLALANELRASPVAEDARAVGLLGDLDGQVTEAFSKREYLVKWGVHFLPSLVHAHKLQQANNFKDPGVQCYGGRMFQRLRDEADDAFNTLPPPEPSRRLAPSAVPRGGGGRGGVGWLHCLSSSASASAGAPTAKAKLVKSVNMSYFNSASNPCFAGDSLVTMGDGSAKPLHALKRGDEVWCPPAPADWPADHRPESDSDVEPLVAPTTATVVCVVETQCQGGAEELVELPGGLHATPWHPVFVQGRWAFPDNLGKRAARPCPAVFSVVLDRGHVLALDGTPAVGLGHGLKGPVLGHGFFGTSKVVDALKQTQGWANGHVHFAPHPVRKDPTTGLACGFDPECEL